MFCELRAPSSRELEAAGTPEVTSWGTTGDALGCSLHIGSGADLTRAIRAYRTLPPCAARGDNPPLKGPMSALHSASGHCPAALACPLWVISGHMQCKRACPLYPQKRTCAVQLGMSALGHKRTFFRPPTFEFPPRSASNKRPGRSGPPSQDRYSSVRHKQSSSRVRRCGLGHL
jgi:hypothetical protein